MPPDPWHFPRPEFTEQVLSSLTQGPAQALTLFAPRRTGKTEFLLKDLAPLAGEREHPVIYASFWQTPFSPLGVLLYELETWLARASVGGRVRSAATALAPKLRLSAAPFGVGVEAEVDLSALGGRPPDALLLHLDGLLERVSRRGRPAILLLDEVQELARRPENEALVAALRTSLDRRSDRLRVVFTGSSRKGLAAMFSARSAPFFHFASQIELPVLGDGFVHHLIEAFRAASGRALSPAEMLPAFEGMGRSPFVFRTLLDVLLHDPALSVQAAMEEVRGRIAASLDYSRVWLSLSPLQRVTAGVLATDLDRPFSKQFRAAVGERLQESPPSAARIQGALRRLVRLDLADVTANGWMLADPEFAAWVRETGLEAPPGTSEPE